MKTDDSLLVRIFCRWLGWHKVWWAYGWTFEGRDYGTCILCLQVISRQRRTR